MTRRPSGALLLSIALHVVLGVAMVYVLSIPYPARYLQLERKRSDVSVERIRFVTVPERPTAASVPAGADTRPASRRRSPSRPRAAAVSAPPTVRAPRTPAVPEGRRGATTPDVAPGRSITPSYSDPRIWVPPAPVAEAPPDRRGPVRPTEGLDSAVAARVRAHNDSLAVHAPTREPGDWTFKRNGKKYGIDRKKIYLGDVSIPTAVLALLPLNVQANPVALERERALAAMHRDINYQAQRALNEEEFREAVKRIRERKERERRRAAEGREVATP